MQSANLTALLTSRSRKLIDLSREIGVNKSTVTRWAQKGVPPERVLEVERVTGISRHDLRPDIYGPDSPRARAREEGAA